VRIFVVPSRKKLLASARCEPRSSFFLIFLLGFDDNSKTEDFFGAFGNSDQVALPGASDGFDAAAFDTTAWGGGEGAVATELLPEDTQEQENDTEPAASGSQDFEDVDANGERKKDASDAQRRPSRRKREEGGSKRRSSGGIEAGVEAMKISESDNAETDAEKKERRSRGPRGEENKDRKRSSSRSKRKARGHRDGRPDKTEESGGDAPRKGGSSFRNPFNRKADS
jgi:hypothetical protein